MDTSTEREMGDGLHSSHMNLVPCMWNDRCLFSARTSAGSLLREAMRSYGSCVVALFRGLDSVLVCGALSPGKLVGLSTLGSGCIVSPKRIYIMLSSQRGSLSRSGHEDEDDSNRTVWRRGMALPERKTETNRKPQPSVPSKPQPPPPKTFKPAPPPKSSAWGAIPKPPVVSPIADSPTQENAKNPEFSKDRVGVLPLDPARQRINQPRETKGPSSSSIVSKASGENRRDPAPKPLANPPRKSAWNIPQPAQPGATPLPSVSYPTLKKQVIEEQKQQQAISGSPSNAKRKKGKGGTLGDVMPKALLRKGQPSTAVIPPPAKAASSNNMTVKEEFPALSARPTKVSAPKKVKATAPSSNSTQPSPTKQNSKSAPKKKKKQTRPASGPLEIPSVVLDAHRSGLLFSGDMVQHIQLGKGRQRLRPRTKKFSSLKKKVLEERLRKYRATQTDGLEGNRTVVGIFNYIQPDDDEVLSDPDEYEELVSNLRDMATKVGEINRVWVADVGCTVQFRSPSDAEAAIQCWDGLVVAGNELKCQSLDLTIDDQMTDEMFQNQCRLKLSESQEEENVTSSMLLEKVLTEDDLEDEECMQESLEDIRLLASQFGTIEALEIEDSLNIRIVYKGKDTATRASDSLSKMVFGGNQVDAKVLNEGGDINDSTIYLENVLTDDDLSDEDCLEESLCDLKELAGKFGTVKTISLFQERKVAVCFSSKEEASAASNGFNGMVIGGQTVQANMAGGSKSNGMTTTPKAETPKPLYSGDKIISERFAICKRAPKLVNSANPRHYAIPPYSPDQADLVKELLCKMLAELMRLQKRAAENEKLNNKARRRLVMGLREVPRGIKSHKVKMVVMANNLDDYGAIDEKLQLIIELCKAEGVPIFFDFSKRALGRAIGKTLKMAVIGVQNADGANQEFKKLNKLAGVM